MASPAPPDRREAPQAGWSEVYTQQGIEWVEETTMIDVLGRHHPALAPALEGVTNAFRPWRKVE